MRKHILTAFLAGILLLSGCSAGDSSAEAVRGSGRLRVALTDEGGAFAEVSEAMADRLGVSVEYIYAADKGQALDMVAYNRADVAVGYFHQNENPGLDYLLTYPFDSSNVYAVCRSGEYITSVAELSGSLLGAQDSLSYELSELIRRSSADSRLYCTDYTAAAEMLINGELDVFFCTEEQAELMLGMNGELRCFIPSDAESEKYCAVVLRTKRQLFGELNGAVGEYITGGK